MSHFGVILENDPDEVRYKFVFREEIHSSMSKAYGSRLRG